MTLKSKSDETIRLAVAGARGRMGRCTVEAAARDPRFTLTAALVRSVPDRADSVIPYGTDIPARCDVLIDFTDAQGTQAWLPACVERGISLVIGTTGHDATHHQRLAEAARHIPIIAAANFSIGIHLLVRMVRELAGQLGPTFDIEIVEAHHRGKTDAPSGTALMLLDQILAARGQARAAAVFGRHGRTGPRPEGQIGVHALRMGDIVGHHEIHFSGSSETLRIAHTAHSRNAFAQGALAAAAWIIHQAPGIYSMDRLVDALRIDL